MRTDVAVVGAGIFGQTIAATLRRAGMSVALIDDDRPESGSRPSGCLMKPSWLASISTARLELAYRTLDECWGLRELTFRVGPVRVDTVRWCDPEVILSNASMRGTAVRVARNHVVLSQAADPSRHVVVEAGQVVVAAGSWCHHLVPGCPPVQAKMGASLFFHGRRIPENTISPWAPYRQLVAFNTPRGVWVGDGTAVKPESWTPARVEEIAQRCYGRVAKVLDPPESERPTLEPLVGRRPYLDKRILYGRPCYLAEHDGVWVATGGAKNGTVAAGWAAGVLAERLT